ncbi:MAG: acylphosphatase [Oscillospiraceae bacterium]|nr:acylphosphatase [Oscillospiraceae bacterium]
MYVINQVKKATLPQFKDGELKREHILFSGKVQNVGFRLEASALAERLGLTGWIKNLSDGRVEGEFQGTQEKIDFLVSFMSSLKRIRIDNALRTPMETKENDSRFTSDRD